MSEPAAARIEIAPHCALTTRSAWLFFLSFCAVCFGFSGWVAAQGFWPVLPFAGLEMGLLGWALQASMKRRHRSQLITVTDNEVVVDETDHKSRSHMVFPRHWAQVKLRTAKSPLHPSRLLIESHGRGCEIGSFLTEQERLGLAKRLRRLIGPVAESPPLPAAGGGI